MLIYKPMKRTNIKTVKKILNETMLHNHPQHNLETNKKQLLKKDTSCNKTLILIFLFVLLLVFSIQIPFSFYHFDFRQHNDGSILKKSSSIVIADGGDLKISDEEDVRQYLNRVSELVKVSDLKGDASKNDLPQIDNNPSNNDSLKNAGPFNGIEIDHDMDVKVITEMHSQHPSYLVLKNASNDKVINEQHEATVEFPLFNKVLSPDSPCNFNTNDTNDNITIYCRPTTCMEHSADVDKKLLPPVSKLNVTDESDENTHCKMLWFAALHESADLCDTSKTKGFYNLDYSVALNSALINAHDSLQPILILGRLGMENENSTKHEKLGQWAEKKGVKVIYSPRLSFQEDVSNGLPRRMGNSHLQGPFLRLDIPKFIRDYDLFDLPNVCKHHVLYTDVDVVFVNKITRYDIQLLTKLVGDDFSASYGREYGKQPHVQNTGVMVINVKRFEKDIPKMLQQARSATTYPNNDQVMLNRYHENENQTKFKLLPMFYNWKTYWKLDPTDFSQIKILHFHGPKPGRGLEGMAKCNLTLVSNKALCPGAYDPLIHQGICCDKGRTAEWGVQTIERLKAQLSEICDL